MFACKRYGHAFPVRYKLVNHLESVRTCKPKQQDISVKDLLLELDMERDNRSAHFCDICGLGFASYSGKYRHMKKSNIVEDKNTLQPHEAKEVAPPDTPDTDGVRKWKEKVEMLEKELLDLKETIKALSCAPRSQTTIQASINNLTIIAPFGSEDIGYILNNTVLLQDCCRNPKGGVPKLVNSRYFNTRHKQNLACDRKRNLIFYVGDGKWTLPYGQKHALSIVVDKEVAVLKDFYNTNLVRSPDYSHTLYNEMSRFLRQYARKDAELYQQICKGVLQVIFDGTLNFHEHFLLHNGDKHKDDVMVIDSDAIKLIEDGKENDGH
jgi:hypothetical protein